MRFGNKKKNIIKAIQKKRKDKKQNRSYPDCLCMHAFNARLHACSTVESFSGLIDTYCPNVPGIGIDNQFSFIQ